MEHLIDRFVTRTRHVDNGLAKHHRRFHLIACCFRSARLAFGLDIRSPVDAALSVAEPDGRI